MKIGSVCSGIGAPEVAWGMSDIGWKFIWNSEIEDFPCNVLKHHFPDVPNYGDMTKLESRILAGEIEAPDVFVGGCPCQAFSVAGLKKSLGDHRGQLTLAFIKIANAIDSVRAESGLGPAIIVYENVPGILHTKDNAFGCFLGALAGEDEAVKPPRKRWTPAGCVLGPQRAIAWRCLDAQYFQLAQRRKRVFVVASSGAIRPEQILFEFDDVREDNPPSRETRQIDTGDAGTGVEGWIRKLTPVEYERLQGFPDGWTDIVYRKKQASDGPRYKALGNSMAVPVMKWLGRRIQKHLDGDGPSPQTQIAQDVDAKQIDLDGVETWAFDTNQIRGNATSPFWRELAPTLTTSGSVCVCVCAAIAAIDASEPSAEFAAAEMAEWAEWYADQVYAEKLETERTCEVIQENWHGSICGVVPCPHRETCTDIEAVQWRRNRDAEEDREWHEGFIADAATEETAENDMQAAYEANAESTYADELWHDEEFDEPRRCPEDCPGTWSFAYDCNNCGGVPISTLNERYEDELWHQQASAPDGSPWVIWQMQDKHHPSGKYRPHIELIEQWIDAYYTAWMKSPTADAEWHSSNASDGNSVPERQSLGKLHNCKHRDFCARPCYYFRRCTECERICGRRIELEVWPAAMRHPVCGRCGNLKEHWSDGYFVPRCRAWLLDEYGDAHLMTLAELDSGKINCPYRFERLMLDGKTKEELDALSNHS